MSTTVQMRIFLSLRQLHEAYLGKEQDGDSLAGNLFTNIFSLHFKFCLRGQNIVEIDDKRKNRRDAFCSAVKWIKATATSFIDILS